jgi:hypothetical protein
MAIPLENFFDNRPPLKYSSVPLPDDEARFKLISKPQNLIKGENP